MTWSELLMRAGGAAGFGAGLLLVIACLVGFVIEATRAIEWLIEKRRKARVQ